MYKLNMRPKYSVVPVLEINEGSNGTISWVGMYRDGSYLHKGDGGVTPVDMLLDSRKGKKLSDCSDEDLARISGWGYPITELRELRKLEREFRQRKR